MISLAMNRWMKLYGYEIRGQQEAIKLGVSNFLRDNIINKRAMMNRKPVFYSNKHERKNVIRISPKIPAKRPDLQLNHRTSKGQSSAKNPRQKNKEHERVESPLYLRQKEKTVDKREVKHPLTEEQIRNSAIFARLREQISELQRRYCEEVNPQKQQIIRKEEEVQKLKKSQFDTKLQIWELKKESFDLKDAIEEEKQETERLVEELNHFNSGNDFEFQSQTDEHEQSDYQMDSNQE